jgi:adenosine deaminase
VSADKGIPKAEIHVHIGGAAPPALARRLAARNGLRIDPALFASETTYAWRDFPDFLRAFDAASAVFRKPVDLRDLVYDYLGACAREGAIYVEFFASPDHAADCGISYAGHLRGLIDGIDDAERDFGIVGRIVMICVRHLGPDRALALARRMKAEPHPYVVGIGMGGDETRFHCRDFAPAYRIAADMGLGCTVHAGEIVGAESVRAALDGLPVTRIGHGVRAIEDRRLVDRIAREGIVLEVCPGSNLALKVFPDAAAHPLKRLIDAGCRVSVSSDDPPFFDTSIGREYRRAAEDFELDRRALLSLTRTAIEGSFADHATKSRLLARIAEAANQGL